STFGDNTNKIICREDAVQARSRIHHEDAMDTFVDHSLRYHLERSISIHPNQILRHYFAHFYVTELLKPERRKWHRLPLLTFRIEEFSRSVLTRCSRVFFLEVENVTGCYQANATTEIIH